MGQLDRSGWCEVPAQCYNLVQHARRRAGGQLTVGLTDNLMFLSASRWVCWNRRLQTELLTWSDFNAHRRDALHEPVTCQLTVNHSYSRTIIHHVYDSLEQRLETELSGFEPHQGGEVISLQTFQD